MIKDEEPSMALCAAHLDIPEAARGSGFRDSFSLYLLPPIVLAIDILWLLGLQAIGRLAG